MAVSSGLAPVVSTAGISAGTYTQWLAYFTAQYQGIFGADVYLGNDSQDQQLLSVFALACADVCASAIAVYNGFSPATAQGAGLSSVVKINGIARLTPSASTAQVTITGTVGVVIGAGVAVDINQNLWTLPATLTIPSAGFITVLATCQTLGAVQAGAGTINALQLAVLGISAVMNATAATPGLPVETDAQLRIRQAASVAFPAQALFVGIVGAIKAVSGVSRVRGIENASAVATADGVPARSVDFIVEGGAQAAIIAAIAARIPPGVPTFGTTTAVVTDATGSTRTVSYEVAKPANFAVTVNVFALAGWASSTIPLIQAAVAAWVSGLSIGANMVYTRLFIPAYLNGTPYFGSFSISSISYSKNGAAAISTNLQLLYNEAPVLTAANVTVVVTGP